jgi:hypothetical protein
MLTWRNLKKSIQIQEVKFMKSRPSGHFKKVLLDYQVTTRLEEIEKLADAVNQGST